MAKLGTKQRPAIVRVQTEARAKEIVSVFNEHGWQFILGIEPDKPENISDLKRLRHLKNYLCNPQLESNLRMSWRACG